MAKDNTSLTPAFSKPPAGKTAAGVPAAPAAPAPGVATPGGAYGESLLKTLSDATLTVQVRLALSKLERTLARAYARKGLPVPTLTHLRRALDLSPIPHVFAEELAVLPEFAPLLERPDFKALLHPTVYTLPEVPAVRGL